MRRATLWAAGGGSEGNSRSRRRTSVRWSSWRLLSVSELLFSDRKERNDLPVPLKAAKFKSSAKTIRWSKIGSLSFNEVVLFIFFLKCWRLGGEWNLNGQNHPGVTLQKEQVLTVRRISSLLNVLAWIIHVESLPVKTLYSFGLRSHVRSK